MRVEKASSATLIAWMLFATALLAVYVVLVATRPLSFGIFAALVFLPFLGVALVTAWMLDDAAGPVVEIDDRGMTVTPVFSSGQRIPWADIEKLSVVAWHYNFFFRVPFMSWLIVHLRDTSHIAPLQWFFPPSWMGRIAIPTRFIEGGRNAALRAVKAAQSGLMEGEIVRERQTAGTDDIMARGEAAIQRALAARGVGSFGGASPRLQAMANLPDTPPARPIPQGYGAEPETVPESAEAPQDYCEEPARIPQPVRQPAAPAMTLQQPGPIMVNGVPYQPQRVGGGFGRKRV